MKVLFETSRPVVLVGGAPVDRALLVRLSHTRAVVAADGGADTAFSAGLIPALVLGDFDSISDLARAERHTRVEQIPDQDTTDFEKALLSVAAPAIVALGFLGARFDHSLAALHALAACQRSRNVMLVGESDIVLRVRGHFDCELPLGLRFSVWPLGRQTFRRSSGLLYPLDGLAMEPGVAIGTSNETTSSMVSIEANDGAGYLVITPLLALDSMLAVCEARAEG